MIFGPFEYGRHFCAVAVGPIKTAGTVKKMGRAFLVQPPSFANVTGAQDLDDLFGPSNRRRLAINGVAAAGPASAEVPASVAALLGVAGKTEAMAGKIATAGTVAAPARIARRLSWFVMV
jgi:hypothetical protein